MHSDVMSFYLSPRSVCLVWFCHWCLYLFVEFVLVCPAFPLIKPAFWIPCFSLPQRHTTGHDRMTDLTRQTERGLKYRTWHQNACRTAGTLGIKTEATRWAWHMRELDGGTWQISLTSRYHHICLCCPGHLCFHQISEGLLRNPLFAVRIPGECQQPRLYRAHFGTSHFTVWHHLFHFLPIYVYSLKVP